MDIEEKNSNPSTAKVIYILLMISTIGITAFAGIIGVIMAYVMRDDSPDWLQSHYRFQIRTFWIGALYFFIGGFTFKIVIGYFIILFAVVWMLIRSAKGLKQLANQEEVKNIDSWLFT